MMSEGQVFLTFFKTLFPIEFPKANSKTSSIPYTISHR